MRLIILAGAGARARFTNVGSERERAVPELEWSGERQIAALAPAHELCNGPFSLKGVLGDLRPWAVFSDVLHTN